MSESDVRKRIYLDHAAATPVRPEVMTAMQPYFSEQFANPSAIHAEGQSARQAVDTARQQLARILGVRASGVIFTASGTEANNLGIYGQLRYLSENTGRSFSDMEIITTKLEHPSVIEPVAHLAQLGVTITYAPVLESGRIDLAAFKGLLSERTVLVVLSYVNSEIGTIEDVKRISRAVRLYSEANETETTVLLDAAQAPLWLPCKLEQLGVDMLTLDAGKCYGPKGVGVLLHQHQVTLKGVVLGGGQEAGLRAGTENVPLIVGTAAAIEIAQAHYEARATKVAALRDAFIASLTELPGVVLNGSATERVANNVNVSIEGVEAEFAVVSLDVAGIACSTKSACGSGKGEGSSVVRTVTGSDERATTTLRFTLGEETTKEELEHVVAEIAQHIEKVRNFNT